MLSRLSQNECADENQSSVIVVMNSNRVAAKHSRSGDQPEMFAKLKFHWSDDEWLSANLNYFVLCDKTHELIWLLKQPLQLSGFKLLLQNF